MTGAQVTLCFLLRASDGAEEVLLGLKKTGFGTGKIVGVGGHLEQGESAAQAICREVAEEVGITILTEQLIPAGTVEFVFPARPEWDMFTTVYLCRDYVGKAVESEEILPHWYPVQKLPHDRMWADATHWVPAFLAGEHGTWRIVMNPDNESVASSTHSL
ncbi:8-oxo-dGTP diphosphatase [Arthrobacter cryoconiti]|uniref:Oxidized purine nucleoside triphosphate hydrolase n=1 Tax=Arthrobacter cryoconiti TaxID=748907 RepID=A0ABV8R430_9MICC|nr:8-oxo-dGTP diphosphatase [Arthrobacter cryoconiti]MCC9069165.1 8-oxo-dGTP diphosphatase [Arthrobacter cryoconiti]